MSRERELLERAYYVLGELSYAILKDSGEYNLAGDIYEFLAEPEPEPEPDPVYLFAGWLTCQPGIMEVGACCDASPMAQAIDQYFQEYPERMFETKLHPAPRPEFVRLSEDEIVSWWGVATEAGLIAFARAIEDALEEKNRG